MSHTSLSLKIAARYKSKQKLESGNTLYVYSPQQVTRRNNEKAKRIEKLKGSLSDLRKKFKSDLKSKDLKTKLTALVVALIDTTFERIGNDQSAEELGHFGVTGWQKKHVQLSGKKAVITYVGKSGVKHEKIVDDLSILPYLKEAYDSAEKETGGLFDAVTSKDVNEYLSEFDITAKDLRGFHANQEMQDRLKAIRAKGPKLPSDKKEREKQLKKEFQEALEETAEAVGHEPATLRNQYLTPGVEDEFLLDGKVSDSFVKKAGMDYDEPKPLVFAHRVLRQLVDHMVGDDMALTPQDYLTLQVCFRKKGGSWEAFLHGDPKHNNILKDVVIAWSKLPGHFKKPETI